jgi:hypothetical protein
LHVALKHAIIADNACQINVPVLVGINSTKGLTALRAINRHTALITLNTANRRPKRLYSIKAITTAGALD